MRIAKCRYVNCFHRLSSLAEVSTKLQKMYFFQQFNPNKPELFLSPCKSGGGGGHFCSRQTNPHNSSSVHS